jgi:poly(A) polymerase
VDNTMIDDCDLSKALGIQKEVQKILGEEVYLVGGSVRDLLMGNDPKDYDFCTPMLPEEIEAKVKAAKRRVYKIGAKFGTIGFKVAYGSGADLNFGGQDLDSDDFDPSKATMGPFRPIYHYVEVTTFRSEVYTSKSRKPEVQFVPSLDEDLARRDFTMNAMVLKPDGKIYDPYGGKIHIHSKEIKTVGMPKDRITEDPLRMLRAARFAARYDFKIDPNFIGKARQLADRIYDVSIERWVQELDKLLTSEYAGQGLHALHSMDLLRRIMPEFDETVADFYDGKKQYEDANLAWRDFIRLVNVDQKVARYMASGICARLKFSNDRTAIVLDKK